MTRFNISIFAALSIASLALTACSGTKNLTKPQIEIPNSLDEVSVDFADSLSVADMAWWDFYTDPALCHIIQRTLESNKDLLIAAARVEELRQLYGIEKLNYLPTINAVVGETSETNHYHDEAFSRDPEISLKATLNWEIDLWGGLSQRQKKRRAQFSASVEDKRAMEVSLIAEAATAYFNLVALENELSIVRQTLVTREEALEKSKLRYEGGLTSEIVYQQAKVELATTAALVPGLERRLKTARNAITLLMGELPDANLQVPYSSLKEDLPADMPAGLPSQLLQRRPDVRSSEMQLRAALANVGIAYSDQFPKLRLSVTGGWENDEWTHLFQSPFSYILGNITGTVLDFGRKRKKYKSQISAYEQARFRYEKSVISAFTEVQNAIITYRMMQQTAAKRIELRNAAYKYIDLANKQYIGGSINYIDVLDAQRRYFDAQISLSNALRDEYLALVQLYKALGGGWSTDKHNKQ